ELIRPKTPASVGGGFQRAVKSSMDSANIQRGLNPPLNEVSFKQRYQLTELEQILDRLPQMAAPVSRPRPELLLHLH
ncbi:MAG: hypothetical protein AB1815_12365, partial [Bacillota bacterium]